MHFVPHCTFWSHSGDFSKGSYVSRDSIPLLSAGFSLSIILPAAFVSLSSGALSALQPRARARIACAGAWHNLLLYLLLVILARSNVAGIVWGAIGYEDVRRFGRVVLGTDVVRPVIRFPQLRQAHTDGWTMLLRY